MPRPLHHSFLLWSSITMLLLGCGSTSTSTRAWEGAAQDDASACEEPDSDQCVVLACDGEAGECGVFDCEDVDSQAVVSAPLAHDAELARAAPIARSYATQASLATGGARGFERGLGHA
jgi:Predicted lipoprotein of unknown function (DUF2380)